MSNVIVNDVVQFMNEFAPGELAEDWDNVGLLVGDTEHSVERIMTCLTLTLDVIDEAIAKRADMVVTHHPIPFRPLKQITTETVTGRVLLQAVQSHIAIHSPHTCFDSAPRGINQRIAEGLGLQAIAPIRPASTEAPNIGAGRVGSLEEPIPAGDLIVRVKEFLGVDKVQRVGKDERLCRLIAIACGAAGEFLSDAIDLGCDAFITGESNFHTCLQARTEEIELILPGHYATERFAVEALATVLADHFEGLNCWASENERDPLSIH